jgi:hypothetical protein
MLMPSVMVGCSKVAQDARGLSASKNMKLELCAPPNNEPVVLATSPTVERVTDAVMQQPWTNITFVVLKRDEQNWLEVSGATGDGFSARYMADGKEFVSVRAPASLEEMCMLMKSYLMGDAKWKTAIKWE